MRKDVPKDELTKLPVVDLDHYCCGAHGLAILIKTTIGNKTYTTLFDSGPDPSTIERNVHAMKVDLTELDAIVLSHWHRDHSGGILKALEIRQAQLEAKGSKESTVKVNLHPDRPIRRGMARPPNFIPFASLPADPTFEEITSLGGNVKLNDQPHEILSKDGGKTGVGVSGEIKRVTEFEKGVVGGVTWKEGAGAGAEGEGKGAWVNDFMIRDERYIVIDVKGHGLVVFSACSHAGICNVLHSLEPLNRPLYSVMGGLHLVPTSFQPAKETIQFLSERVSPPPKYIVPLHCTGLEPRAALREKFGEGCVSAGTGMRVIWPVSAQGAGPASVQLAQETQKEGEPMRILK